MRIVHASDWHGHKMGLVSGKLPEGDLSGLRILTACTTVVVDLP